MSRSKRLLVVVLCIGILGFPGQPAGANPVVNTSFKITEGANVYLLEISHPESLTCAAYSAEYLSNCRLNFQYRLTSGNTTRGIIQYLKFYNEQNVIIDNAMSLTFLSVSPSADWRKESIGLPLAKNTNVYLGFLDLGARYEAISKTLIALKVNSPAEQAAVQAAEQAAIDKKRNERLLAEQQVQNAKKLTITCQKGSQRRTVTGETPTCPSGFKNPMSPFLTYQAFSKCQLYKKDISNGGATLTDGGRTLTLKIRESFLLSSSLTYSDFECAKKVLRVSSFVGSQISSTRAIDGVQKAQWGKISAFWNFHPDSGLNISFNSK